MLITKTTEHTCKITMASGGLTTIDFCFSTKEDLRHLHKLELQVSGSS